jgi:hypothetical protein
MRSLEGVPPTNEEKLALYPHETTLAFSTYFGKNSGCDSQHTPLFEVHVLNACPFKPCTATIL